MQRTPQPPPSPAPARLLALDPGSARIGVAVSDELGLYAHTRPALKVSSPQQAVDAAAKLVRGEGVDEVLVGLPLTLGGERGHQAEEVRSFVEKLRERVSVPVTEVDERLSSAQAAALRPELGNRRDGTLDSASAAVILQAVLDARRRGARR